MLAKAAGLYDHRARMRWAQVDQRQLYPIVAQSVDQRRHVFGQAGPALFCVKVAHPALHQSAPVNGLRSAHRQLLERLGHHRVALLPVVLVHFGQIGLVLHHHLQASTHFGVVGLENSFRIVGQLAGQVARPRPIVQRARSARSDLSPLGFGPFSQRFQALPVAPMHRSGPQVNRVLRNHRPVFAPALIRVLKGHLQRAVALALSSANHHIQLRANQLQVLAIAGQHLRALGRDHHRRAHHVQREATGPAVKAAPPLALSVFAGDPVGPHVVGNDAVVVSYPLLPRLDVVDHPLAIALLARVQKRVGHQHHHA